MAESAASVEFGEQGPLVYRSGPHSTIDVSAKRGDSWSSWFERHRFPKFAVVMVDKQRGIDDYYNCLCIKLSVQYLYCNTLGRSLVKPACTVLSSVV